jgi:hypothetical protein
MQTQTADGRRQTQAQARTQKVELERWVGGSAPHDFGVAEYL